MSSEPSSGSDSGGASDGEAKVALEAGRGLRALKRILRTDIGFFEREILYRAGEAGAESYFEKRREALGQGTPTILLGQILSILSSDGLGEYRLESVDEGNRTAEMTAKDALEILGLEDSDDREKAPSCSYTSGFLAGICKCAFGDEGFGNDEIFAHETECVSQGSPRCKFIVAPRRELERRGYKTVSREESISEHTLRLNEEILLRNLDLQNLALSLERKVRKRTEELRRSKDDYRSLINLSPDPILFISMDGSIVSVNHSVLDLLGYANKDEVEGMSVQDLLPEGSNKFSALKWALEKEGSLHNFEMILETRLNGEVTVEASARIAEIDQERCIQAILRDVTERNKLEKQLIEANEEADFLNDLLSHDIINYASAAMHFIETLEKSQTLSEPDRKHLRTVSKSVRCAHELATVVRDARRARLLVGKDCDSRDLVGVLREAIDESKKTYADRKVIIRFDPPSDPCRVQGNALLTRLFANLLTNAIKFDHNEEVMVDVEVIPTEASVEYWQVRISDRGRGIPDEDKTRVFDRYYRRDPTIPGTGLGLHLVSHIAESCGGSVGAENRVSGDYRKGTVMVTNLRKANGQISTGRSNPASGDHSGTPGG